MLLGHKLGPTIESFGTTPRLSGGAGSVCPARGPSPNNGGAFYHHRLSIGRPGPTRPMVDIASENQRGTGIGDDSARREARLTPI
jgi:hypothetical protein